MSQGSDLTKEDNSKPTDVKTQLIHIVPFDYGFCFAKKNSASNLLQKIERFCEQENYQVKNLKAPFLCAVTINQNLSCRFFRCGVGVFVLQGGHSFRRNDGFPLDDLAGRLYWVKKTEQREILEYRTKDALQLKQFCEKLRTLFSTTSFSAKSQYKHKGLSYVLTVYVLREPVKDFDIDALMNPAIFSGILNQDQWINIAEARKRYQSKGYEVEPLDESTKVTTSWSAVAILYEEEQSCKKARQIVIEYEVLLQACWFFLDAASDALESNQFTVLQAQQSVNTAKEMILDCESIVSANMPTGQRSVMKKLLETSQLDIIGRKTTARLETFLSLESTKRHIRQVRCENVIEILLAGFTALQIFDPVKRLITGGTTNEDILTIIVLVAILCIFSLFVMGKNK